MFTTPQHIPDPKRAKAKLNDQLAALRERFTTPPAPAPETFVTSEAVTVKFDDLPAFYAARGVMRVTVEFPESGPFAGKMVVRRAA